MASPPPEPPPIDPTPRGSLRGRYLLSNWIWLLIVLALVGVVVWGWAFNYAN